MSVARRRVGPPGAIHAKSRRALGVAGWGEGQKGSSVHSCICVSGRRVPTLCVLCVHTHDAGVCSSMFALFIVIGIGASIALQ